MGATESRPQLTDEELEKISVICERVIDLENPTYGTSIKKMIDETKMSDFAKQHCRLLVKQMLRTKATRDLIESDKETTERVNLLIANLEQRLGGSLSKNGHSHCEKGPERERVLRNLRKLKKQLQVQQEKVDHACNELSKAYGRM